MKTIKDLDVKVTYRVGLGDIKVPDKVFKQLTEISEKGIELDATGMTYPEANDLWVGNLKFEYLYIK